MNPKLRNKIQDRVAKWKLNCIIKYIKRYSHVCNSITEKDFTVRSYEIVSIRNWEYLLYFNGHLVNKLLIDSYTGEVINEKNRSNKKLSKDVDISDS